MVVVAEEGSALLNFCLQSSTRTDKIRPKIYLSMLCCGELYRNIKASRLSPLLPTRSPVEKATLHGVESIRAKSSSPKNSFPTTNHPENRILSFLDLSLSREHHKQFHGNESNSQQRPTSYD